LALELEIGTAKAEAALKAIERNVTALGGSLNSLGKTSGIDQLGAKLAAIKGPGPEAAAALARLSDAISKLSSSNNLAALSKQMSELARLDVSAVAASMQRLSTAMAAVKVPPGLAQAAQAMQQLATAATAAAPAMARLNASMQGVAASSAQAGAAMRQFHGGAQQATTGSRALAVGIGTAVAQMAIMAAQAVASGLGGFITDSIKAAQAVEQFSVRLQSVGLSAQGAARQWEFVTRTANTYALSIESLSTAYAQFAPTSAKLGVSLADTNRTFETFAVGMKAAGMSSQEVARAFDSMSRMLSSGTGSVRQLSAAFNDQIPVQALLQKAMGMSATEVDKLLQTSGRGPEILSRLADAIKEAYGQNLQSALSTSSSALTLLSNALTSFQASFGEAFLTSILPSLRELARVLADPGAQQALANLGTLVGTLAGLFVRLGTIILQVWGFITGFSVDIVGKSIEALTGKIKAITPATDQFRGALQGLSGAGNSAAGGINSSSSAANSAAGSYLRAATAASSYASALRQMGQSISVGPKGATYPGGGYEEFSGSGEGGGYGGAEYGYGDEQGSGFGGMGSAWAEERPSGSTDLTTGGGTFDLYNDPNPIWPSDVPNGNTHGGGGFTGANLYQTGGLTDLGTAFSKLVPTSVFHNARRFADGGLSSGEIPAILHPNEAVIPLSGGGAVPVDLGGASNNPATIMINLMKAISDNTKLTNQSVRVAHESLIDLGVIFKTESDRHYLRSGQILSSLSNILTSGSFGGGSNVSSGGSGAGVDTSPGDGFGTDTKVGGGYLDRPDGVPDYAFFDTISGQWMINSDPTKSVAKYQFVSPAYDPSSTSGSGGDGWGWVRPYHAAPIVDRGSQFALGSPNAFKDMTGGMQAMLHPNEAVIPLPDGRAVPVDMGSNQATLDRLNDFFGADMMGGGASSAGGSSKPASAGGGGNMVVNLTMNVSTPDVHAFGKSKAQILQDFNRSMKSAIKQLGETGAFEDPTRR
jgi:hypothetical protein